MAHPEPVTWLLQISPPAPLLNLNSRRDRRSNPSRPWRAAAWAAAKKAQLPTGLARVRIDVVVWLPPRSNPDQHNLHATVKALVDGLGPPYVRKPNPATGFRGAAAPGYNLIPNDDRKHLDGPHLHVADDVVAPLGRVDVYVTDLGWVADGRTWTPTLRTSSTATHVTAKRACNGCRRPVGDATSAEIEAALAGVAIASIDVRGECLTCGGHG